MVTGATGGIVANNNGSGKTTVESASVTGTGFGSAGISATGRGTDIIVNATGPVSGGVIGISTSNQGTGSTTITATEVTGTNSEGIAAFNSIGTTDLTITVTGLVSGGSAGIDANNNGTGDLTINTAAVTGLGRQGISALNSFLGKGLSITATGDINGVGNGIEATPIWHR